MRIRALIPLLLLGSFGCTLDEEVSGLRLLGYYGLKAEDDGCTRTDDMTSFGHYDVAVAEEFGFPYLVYAHLRNDLAPTGDESNGRVDSNPVEVTRMRLVFEGEGWPTLPAPMEIPVTGTLIEPADEHWKLVEAIPAEVAGLLESNFERVGPLSKELRVRISFVGRTLDGTTVESNALTFKVFVCNGCFAQLCGGLGVVQVCAMAGAQGDGVSCLDDEL